MKARIDDLWEPDGELTAAEVEELLFDAASVFSTAEERNRFLRFACRGQPELLNRIGMLLGTLAEAEDFFEFEPQVMAGETGEEVGAPPEGHVDRVYFARNRRF